MGQRSNVLSQRLDLNLIWQHNNSFMFFKNFFCYKILFDFFLIRYFKFYGFGLINFNLGYNKSFFFLKIFFYNYENILFLNLRRNINSFSKFNNFFNFFYNFYKIKNNNFLSAYNIKSKNIFFLKNFYKLLKFNKNTIFIHKQKSLFLNIFFLNLFSTSKKKLLTKKKSKLLSIFYLKNIKYFLNTRKIKIMPKNILHPLILTTFMFYSNYSQNISFLIKKNNYNSYKKGILRFLFQHKFNFFLKKKSFISLFDSQLFLNRFNQFESSLNITNLVIKRRNIFISKKERFFFKTLIQVLLICLRFKQIGLFAELVSNKLVLSQHNQWGFIRLLRKFLYYLNVNTIYFLGIHILLKGKFQRRRRKKRVHLLKWAKPSSQVFILNIFYCYKQSISIYGVLGVKIWFYY